MPCTLDVDSLAGRLRQHVETLARTPRVPGTPEHRRAAAYVREHLHQAGFTADEHPFREAGLFGVNVLTKPVPEEGELPRIIVAAHYDSIPDSPGADDNASAVAALLELASWLGPRLGEQCHAQLQLAAFDLEEWGMLGSYLHARELRGAGRPLSGMISLEMLGYTDPRPGSQGLPPHLKHLYPDVGNFIGVCANAASEPLLRTVVEGMRSIPGLPVEFITVPDNGRGIPEVRLSDHSSFWDLGYPALMITDTSFFRNPHYHRASDTPETLDYPFLAKVTAGVVATVTRLCRLPEIR